MEIHHSRLSKTTYLKWPLNIEADRYKIVLKNGKDDVTSIHHPEYKTPVFVTKNVYQIPDTVDLAKIDISVTDYSGNKKISPEKKASPLTTRFFFIT